MEKGIGKIRVRSQTSVEKGWPAGCMAGTAHLDGAFQRRGCLVPEAQVAVGHALEEEGPG